MVQDLSLFVNTLLFTCSIQPGLADVIMELMDFEGVAMRLRKVIDFPGRGAHLVGKTVASMSHEWDDAVLLGIAPASPMEAERADPNNGMAPNAERRILESD